MGVDIEKAGDDFSLVVRFGQHAQRLGLAGGVIVRAELAEQDARAVVQGHVDGVGTVKSVTPSGNALVVTITAPPEVTRLSVDQGSIAIDGISLTIVQIRGSELGVSVIPHSAKVTTIGGLRPGARFNAR